MEKVEKTDQPTKKKSSNVRMLVLGLVIIIVIAIVVMRGHELNEFLDAVKKGSPYFLIAAVALQLGKYITQGFGYKACFKAVGAQSRFKMGLMLVFGTFFLNTVAPSFNLAGISLVIDRAKKNGIPAGKGTGAAFLMQLCIDTGFVVIMLIAFTILEFTVGLKLGWFLLGLVAIALVGGLALAMFVAGKKPDFVKKILYPVERAIDWILRKFKRKPINPWVDSTIDSFSNASKQIVSNRARTIKAFAISILASAFECSCFIMCGFAFGEYSLEPLICGYVLATLFAMLAITPQGVGVVETAVMVGFSMFGVDSAAGLAIVLVYRGIVFWLPFLIGAIVIQRIGFKTSEGEAEMQEEQLKEKKEQSGSQKAQQATLPPEQTENQKEADEKVG